MFGKLVDGVLVYAPCVLKADGLVHYHPSDKMYKNQGYLPVINTPYPNTEEDNKYFKSVWEEVDGQIVEIWEETEPQQEINTPTIEDRVIKLENNLENTMQAVDYLILGEEGENIDEEVFIDEN